MGEVDRPSLSAPSPICLLGRGLALGLEVAETVISCHPPPGGGGPALRLVVLHLAPQSHLRVLLVIQGAHLAEPALCSPANT